MKILVTGGAGFIGSHLIDYLLNDGHQVVCLDDLSLGRKAHIKRHQKNVRFTFTLLDILDLRELNRIFEKNKFDCVFHLAANSDIQRGAANPALDLKRTFFITFNILECMKWHQARQIVFLSSSAIYGDLKKVLRENMGPLLPISFYGAAKLSSEGFISAFCANCAIKAWILRLPNVVGERQTHGVLLDFIRQLRKNPKELIILGDGRQKKPYVYVKDLVEGIILAWKKSNRQVNYFNLGVESSTTVREIARLVVETMGLRNVKIKYTGGDRGWTGDVPHFQYKLSKINQLGWTAKRSSNEAITMAAQLLSREINKKEKI